MSHFLDKLIYFTREHPEVFSDGQDITATEDHPVVTALASSLRLKYPLIRSRLLKLWRETKNVYMDPVAAWGDIVENSLKAESYKQMRGGGGLVRANWDEINEIIAAANIYTA
ncbi:MAG: molybdopterin-dependent oxidoreductase, partial [Emcibacter sp.]|nr:molybdopterin-dependent oxidoreductase [Emcibacter sp.]